jgi:peptide/nickel transport system ATP-binding protein
MTDRLVAILGLPIREARARVLRLLEEVQISDPARVLRSYPHELSGGMRQRVLIAAAFAAEPKLIVADEPTTALDVTVQKQILKLIVEMQARHGTALLFVSHNMGVVAKLCSSVSVLHAGMVVEEGPAERLFMAPMHAYTRALLAATPRYDQPENSLVPVAPAVIAALGEAAAEADRAWGSQRKLAGGSR